MLLWIISVDFLVEKRGTIFAICVMVGFVTLPAGTFTVPVGPVTTPIDSSAVSAVSATMLIS